MKKVLLTFAVILLCFSLFGCNNQRVDSIIKNERSSLDDAVLKAINHYNSTEKDNQDLDFPTTLKNGNTVSKMIKIGGRQGSTTKLDMSVSAEKKGNKYIVTLLKDYNITVNGTKAISSWRYEIANTHIDLLGKKEDGKKINDIK